MGFCIFVLGHGELLYHRAIEPKQATDYVSNSQAIASLEQELPLHDAHGLFYRPDYNVAQHVSLLVHIQKSPYKRVMGLLGRISGILIGWDIQDHSGGLENAGKRQDDLNRWALNRRE